MTRVLTGDCREVLAGMGAASVDVCITDPPYGIRFMSKGWDHGVPGVEFWCEVLRVLAAGARLLAFGGTRTYHRLACAIEDAGFEIEDSLCWLYGSGFPKHKSKLKPAHEPIVMARKPARTATLLNIDGCRLEGAPPSVPQPSFNSPTGLTYGFKTGEGRNGSMSHATGRWPANVLLDDVAARALDEQSGERGSFLTRDYDDQDCSLGRNGIYGKGEASGRTVTTYADTGGASRFFFVSRQPNESTPNESLNLCRAKAILWAWNPDLASTADDRTNLSSEHAVSVLSRVVVVATQSAAHLSDISGLSTSVTPTALKTLCVSVIELILSSASDVSRGPQHGGHTPSNSHANGAATRELTGTTTATIGHSTSDGSAVVVTLTATPSNTVVGGQDSRSNRMFYTAKASRSERERGLEGAERKPGGSLSHGQSSIGIKDGRNRPVGNHHPTVKPVDLMRWLVRLVTPENGLVLDPFCGSGSTGVAAILEDRRFLGIEREPEYVEIAERRISRAAEQGSLFRDSDVA